MATIDYSMWYITLPVDANNAYVGEAKYIKPAGNTQVNPWYYVNTAGEQIFRAPVEGATTSGSNYARSELRELTANGALAAWQINSGTGGQMNATLKVKEVPTKLSTNTAGKVVIGQIHGPSDELVRMYYDAGEVYFVNDLGGNTAVETKYYLLDTGGAHANVALNTSFSYKIRAKGHTLSVYAYIGGVTYSSVTTINSIWDGQDLYFKAGVYLGQNETNGTGFGETAFSTIAVTHAI